MQKPRRNRKPESDLEIGADPRDNKWVPEEYMEIKLESEKKVLQSSKNKVLL